MGYLDGRAKKVCREEHRLTGLQCQYHALPCGTLKGYVLPVSHFFMKTSTTVATAIAVIAALGAGTYWYASAPGMPWNTQDSYAHITTFEECALLYPIMESYPPRCGTPDGRTFTQNIGNELEKANLITIDAPRPTAVIASPLAITGKARGYWFFEASFPVELRDAQNQVLAQGVAQAQGDWMTEDFVPYSVNIAYPPQPTGSMGTLILKRDNPSGEPQNDDSLIVPVQF